MNVGGRKTILKMKKRALMPNGISAFLLLPRSVKREKKDEVQGRLFLMQQLGGLDLQYHFNKVGLALPVLTGDKVNDHIPVLTGDKVNDHISFLTGDKINGHILVLTGDKVNGHIPVLTGEIVNGHLPVLIGDKVDGHTKMAVSSGPADTMQICLGLLREVKVDDNVHSLNVYTSCEQVCMHKPFSVEINIRANHQTYFLLRII